ncbi:hypothetical protein GIB67_032337, partial [Kingdonia uniflora]
QFQKVEGEDSFVSIQVAEARANSYNISRVQRKHLHILSIIKKWMGEKDGIFDECLSWMLEAH